MLDERTPKDVCGEASEIDEEKRRWEMKGKRGGNPRYRPSLLSFSLAYDLINSLPHHLNSALSDLNAWNMLKDKRESVLNLVVGTRSSCWYVIHSAAQSIAQYQGYSPFSIH